MSDAHPVSRETVMRHPSDNNALASTTNPHSSSASPTTTSGRAGRGEAPALPDAHGTSTGEKRHRKAGEPLCAACRKWRTDYDREYSRLRRMNPTSRAKQAQVFANWERRNREHRNAYARNRARELRERAEQDRLRGVDPVVVDRLVNGDRVPHNRAEKVEAMRQLLVRGSSLTDAARHLGLNGKYARKYADLIAQEDVA